LNTIGDGSCGTLRWYFPADRLVGDVARSAEANRQHAVLRIERRAVIRPLVLGERAIDVEIGHIEPERLRKLRELRLRDQAVAVGIGGLPHLFRSRHRHLVARIGFGNRSEASGRIRMEREANGGAVELVALRRSVPVIAGRRWTA